MFRAADRLVQRFPVVISAIAIVSSFASSLVAAPAPSGSLAYRGVPLSAAYERMLRDQIAAGRVLDPAVVRRFGLDLPEEEPGFQITPWEEAPSSNVHRGLTPLGPGVALQPDAQLNNKAGDVTCPSCTNRPLGQAETTIAALGNFLVAGWNDTQGFCTGGAVQGYAWSTNGGATWVDAGDPPALPGGGRYRGDPVHAVNINTGQFYILGLYEGGTMGSGLALARGHFAGGSFVIDDDRQIAIGGSNFLDKEWMAVDSGTGNLYVSYTNFLGGQSGQIEFIRSTDNGVSWSTPLVLNQPAALNLVQGSRPAVGPDGELYVIWYEFGSPFSHMRIRRSDDFGQTFGTEHTVCDFYENVWSGAPGFRRGFGIALPSIAVDLSNGPHRGRVHAAWDESVNFYDAPFTTTSTIASVENDNFYSRANAFTVGGVLRGALSVSTDIDVFRFTGTRGQTLYFYADSAAGVPINMRLVCSSDTVSNGTTRFLAFDQSTLPALAFTLPNDGTYYMRLSLGSTTPSGYRILTAWDTPSAGERARDHRDGFIAHSDDGASWSTPARIVDSNPWFDGEFPEITVDGTGAVHAYWHDFRDDPVCGAESYEYIVSSGDGGTTWGPNRRLSDARSFWSFEACGSANHGDYQGITSYGSTVFPCWTDSRLGDPDVWSEADTHSSGADCPADRVAPAGSTQSLSFAVRNFGNVGGTFAWNLVDDHGWVTGVIPAASGSVSLAAGASQSVDVTLAVPASCPNPNGDAVQLVVRDLDIPGRADTCVSTVRCVSATDVITAATPLFFNAPRPNPSAQGARFQYGLTHHSAVQLVIYSANGARVRTLVAGREAAGLHEAPWNGRDESGRRTRAGVYYAVLDAEGRRMRQPVVVMP